MTVPDWPQVRPDWKQLRPAFADGGGERRLNNSSLRNTGIRARARGNVGNARERGDRGYTTHQSVSQNGGGGKKTGDVISRTNHEDQSKDRYPRGRPRGAGHTRVVLSGWVERKAVKRGRDRVAAPGSGIMCLVFRAVLTILNLNKPDRKHPYATSEKKRSGKRGGRAIRLEKGSSAITEERTRGGAPKVPKSPNIRGEACKGGVASKCIDSKSNE